MLMRKEGVVCREKEGLMCWGGSKGLKCSGEMKG